MLELSHIDKYYNPGSVNEMCLFQDFNLTIPDSQFVSVVGSNGSGKTSMLNLICGSISADAGKVIVNGTDITFSCIIIKALPNDTRKWVR